MSRKALLIGINYVGSDNELDGCHNDVENIHQFLVEERGWSEDEMTVMTDTEDNNGTDLWPSKANIEAQVELLVTDNEDDANIFLYYSGHGGQVKDLENERASGYDDTICPVDYEDEGQLSADEVSSNFCSTSIPQDENILTYLTLHRMAVSPMNENTRLTILFDSCHSGSACELPYVYRPDADGQPVMVNTLQKGMQQVMRAKRLIKASSDDEDAIHKANIALGKAMRYFKSVACQAKTDAEIDEDGLTGEVFQEDWHEEGKDVWMFSGCASEQFSEETTDGGEKVGAMSAAFMDAMRENPEASYIEILYMTRDTLADKDQIPQLSCGGRYDLDQPVRL